MPASLLEAFWCCHGFGLFAGHVTAFGFFDDGRYIHRQNFESVLNFIRQQEGNIVPGLDLTLENVLFGERQGLAGFGFFHDQVRWAFEIHSWRQGSNVGVDQFNGLGFSFQGFGVRKILVEEFQDDFQFLLVGIPCERVRALSQEERRQLGFELDQMMPRREGELTWMLNFTLNGKVVDSYFGGDSTSPELGL